MPLQLERLQEIVTELASRPGHEKVRALVYQLLVDGLGASSTEVHLEKLQRVKWQQFPCCTRWWR